MQSDYVTVPELRRAISEEILVAAGVPRTGLLQTVLRPLLWYPAHRFARLAAEFDRRVALEGLTAQVLDHTSGREVPVIGGERRSGGGDEECQESEHEGSFRAQGAQGRAPALEEHYESREQGFRSKVLEASVLDGVGVLARKEGAEGS